MANLIMDLRFFEDGSTERLKPLRQVRVDMGEMFDFDNEAMQDIAFAAKMAAIKIRRQRKMASSGKPKKQLKGGI